MSLWFTSTSIKQNYPNLFWLFPDRPLAAGGPFKDSEPDLFIRGKEIYRANLNPENPLGTIASIEHTLRGLDRKAEDEQREVEQKQKALADYKAQLNRPFEH